MKLNPQFTFEKVRFDQDTNCHLVLSLTAPKSDWQAKRPPLCIIPVVDVSGSMRGDKLEYAKRSLLKLVDNLTGDDYFGLVRFSSQANVDLPPERMTPEFKEKARAIISKYQDEGSTNFSDGMLLGLKLANSCDLPATTIVRVIMFTDGQPTHGVTDTEGLCTLLVKQAGIASVSAFGYGRDAVHELLSSLAEKGKGNFAWVQDPDGALAAFGKELGGLLSNYAQNITIELAPHSGHQISEVISDVEVEEETTGEAVIKIPQILSEETMHIVIALKLATQKQAGPRQVNAVSLKLAYRILDKDGNFEDKLEEVKAKIQFVKAGEEQSTPTKDVDELVARAQLAKVQVVAEAAAARGEYKTAGLVFDSLSLNERGHVGVANMSTRMKNMYTDSHTYTASGGNRVGLRNAMRRGVGTSALAAEDAAVLQESGYGGGSNFMQEEMIRAFEEPVTPVATPDSGLNQPILKVETTPIRTSLSKPRTNQW
jgi:hypothetical protein